MQPVNTPETFKARGLMEENRSAVKKIKEVYLEAPPLTEGTNKKVEQFNLIL
jgi:hypothetical protein